MQGYVRNGEWYKRRGDSGECFAAQCKAKEANAEVAFQLDSFAVSRAQTAPFFFAEVMLRCVTCFILRGGISKQQQHNETEAEDNAY